MVGEPLMAAELVQLEVFHDGLRVGTTDTTRLDLDDDRSTKQLDSLLTSAAERHGRGPLSGYHLRVLDRHGNRVLLDNFRVTG
ncbi:hypothetical protein [Pseudonocardia sp. NPDC049635]|uniref:hypothetical protein n=1 Tax=Pseudonocardia sp. NPDC049635 TaxID=3155506 RepID=UPI0033F97A24